MLESYIVRAITESTLSRAALSVFLVAVLLAAAGCGGGGGDASDPVAASGVYALKSLASTDVGPVTTTILAGSAMLEASLADTQTVTVAERFYTSGRPSGLIGKVYDIQPDGLPFVSGTRFCISASGTGYSPAELEIVTGPALDQYMDSLPDYSGNRVCAALSHSSPYSIKRARSLTTPDYTIFGSLYSLDTYKYDYKVVAENGTDSWGSYYKVDITVNCDFNCIESGRRQFRFYQGGDNDGDLYIDENEGTYPMWLDFAQMKWAHLKSADGATVGGIAYLLSAEFCKFFLGSSSLMDSYIKMLDPDQNSLQRFFYKEGKTKPYLFVELIKDETLISGKVKVNIEKDDQPLHSYLIDRTTASITETWTSTIDGLHTTTVTLSDSGYSDMNQYVLYYVYLIVGLDDTPDETRGDPYDVYDRYLPVQELFAVNVMNLLKGQGWQNLEAIEVYYRDRLEMWNGH